MLLTPGTEVDRYVVESELGRGGMARVYLVRHRTLDARLALKVLTLSGEELRERLLREGRVQSRFNHPNIVAVRDVLDLAGGPGLLMDYVDGPNLDRWLAEDASGEDERERVFLEILDGVGHAHAHGVVHRDLKPANVLMERRHGVWHPRVTDFGLAKVVGGEDDPEGVQSRTGRPMGTPAYMAPEQVRSAKHVDHRADVFALGCILYEMATGHRAFVGDSSLEVFNRVTQGRFVAPRDRVGGLPPRLEAAVLGALTLDPDARIPDCATLRRVLLGQEPWSNLAVRAGDTMIDLDDPAPRAEPTLAPTSRPPGVDSAVPRSIVAPVAHDASQPSLAPVAPASVAPASVAPASVAPASVAPASVAPASVAPPPASRAVPAGPVALVALVVLAAGVGVLAGTSLLRPAGVSPVVSAPAPPPPVPVTTEAASAPAAPSAAAPSAAAPATPALTVPKPAPARAAPPREAPAGASLPSGAATVTFLGDARSVRLRASDGSTYAAGSVPPGTYVLEASFDAGPAVHAGNGTVQAGGRYRFDCRAATFTCTPVD